MRLLGNLFDKNNFIGRKGYYLNSTGDGVDWRADLNETSGIFYGGVISATIGGTTFNITAGSGQVVTRALVNNEVVTTNKIVSWNAQNNITLTYRTTHQFSYIYVDENGVLQQQNSSFTDAEYQNKIVVGTICHINYSTINLVTNKQNIAYGDSHRIYEFANSFGPIKRSGLSIGAYSTNLRITRGAGSVFSIGCNYASDQFNADSPNISAANPALLCRVSQNGSGGFIFDTNSGSYYTDIDPNNYDNGSGTLQTVNNNQWTIQRLYFFPNNPNDVITYYGRAIYNSYTDAIAAISTESFSEATITLENAVFLGYLVLRGGATNLSSSSDGVFFQSGAFRNTGAITGGGGGGGGGATTLDDLTDVQLSSVLGGQFLTYDSTTSLWKNRSYILDANNNELIKFPSTVTGAVNELTISNAATTGSPSISATGDDTNIGLNLISKGTGLVQINGKAISLANSFTTSGNYPLTFTTTATTSLILPTSGTLATTSQIPTVYDNTLTLAGSGGIGVGTSPTFTANSSTDKTITISIADGALTIAKLENIDTSRILGRISSGTGAVELLDGSGVVSVIGTNAVTRATNLAGGIAGQIPYQSGANTTSFSAAGTTNQVLLSGGSGAPTWADQSSLSVGSATTAGSLVNALTIQSPLTGTSYNGSSAVTIGLQNATASLSGGVSTSAQTFGGDKTFANNVIISGDLTVNGTTVTVNTTTLAVKDKNIELGLVSVPSDVTADGGGITLKGTTDKTIIWVDATDAWTLSEHLNIASGKVYRINGTDVLSSTTLGSGVVNSSLTSVGTLTNLTVTNTITGSVSGSAGSLSGTYTFWGQSFNGTQNVSGNLTSVGNITGSSGITITAGGSNQNIVLTPSGTGYTLLNGSVGIGNSTPNNKLTIQAGDDKDSGPIINLGGNAVNQFESGRIRFTEVVTGVTPFYQGAYLHYDGSNNLFHIGVHDSADSLIASDINAISIVRSSGNVGIGTTAAAYKLDVNGIARFRDIVRFKNNSWNLSDDGNFRLFFATGGRTYFGSQDGYEFRNSSDSSLMVLSNSGNLGIGVGTPSQLLHISSTGTAKLKIAADTDNVDENDIGGIEISQDGGVTTSYFGFDSSNNLILGVNSTTSPNIYIGTRSDGTNFVSSSDAKITILNSGSVGVGTSNPNSKLHLYGSGEIVQRIESAGSRTYGLVVNPSWRADSFSIYDLTGDAARLLINSAGRINIGGGSNNPNNLLTVFGPVSIGSGYNIAAPTNGLIIEGNVGVGTTSSNSKLTIVGDGSVSNFSGVLRVADTSTIGKWASIGLPDAQASTTAANNYYLIGRAAAYTDRILSFHIPNATDYGSGSQPKFGFYSTGGVLLHSIEAATGISYFLGNVGIGTSSPSNTIDINGTARVRTISASASTATIFLTTDANGVLISRTAAQVRSDIGAGTGNGTVTSVTGTAPIASSGGTTPAISLNDAGVTFAKIQNISSGTVIGRTAAGTGVTSEIDGAGIASIISTNAVTNSTNAANVTIATDDTTNSSYYLYFGANASGNTPIKASTKIRYNPSSGAFSATTKSFRIPHPTKPQHDLVYGSLESPYHGIRLTGKGKTKGNYAEVILPDYVKVLIDENTINIQLTVIKSAKILYIDDIIIDDNKFIVKYNKSWYEKSKDIEFYWDFTAERKDVPKLIVEEKL